MVDFTDEIKALKNNKTLKKFIKDNYDRLGRYDWYEVQKSESFTLDIADEYPDKMNWRKISTFMKLPQEFIEKHLDEVDWFAISAFQHIGLKFIKKHKDRLSLINVKKNTWVKDQEWFPDFLEIYEEEDNPVNQIRWQIILAKNTIFAPEWLVEKYKSGELEADLEKVKKEYKPAPKKKETKTETAAREKRELLIAARKEELSKHNKKELQTLAGTKGVKILYKDTISDIIEKIIKKEFPNSKK